MPLDGVWVQQGWGDQGVAQVVVARTQPNDEMLFGSYLVDYFCTGVKSTSHAVNVEPSVFQSEVVPRFYQGSPPVAISEELAHEIIWGAVEYAEALGFRPPRDFRESQRVLEPADALPRTGAVQFGYQGRPLYVPGTNDNQVAVLRRLIDAVGLGNFYYAPQDDVPDDVVELLGIDRAEGAERSALWTPGEQQESGAGSEDSGLWLPGRQGEATATATATEPAEPGAIWTPGRR